MSVQKTNGVGEVAPSWRRILIIDDMQEIHDDFRKVLAPEASEDSALNDLAAAVLDVDLPSEARQAPEYELSHAMQGEDGLKLVRAALRDGHPYGVIFVDLRMPPGWDGLETMQRIWAEDPSVQIVLCTAYSDYSWEELFKSVEHVDQLIVLKKPFDVVEVRQLALALSERWLQARGSSEQRDQMLERIDAGITDLRSMCEASPAEIDTGPGKDPLARFMARVCKNLRTILGSKLEFIDAMEQPGTAMAEHLRAIQTMQQCCARVASVMGDVIAMGRNAGAGKADSIEFSPAFLVADVVSLMQAPALAKGLTIEIQHRGPFPKSVESDPTVLRQIMLTLLSNSIKHADSGKIDIVMELTDGRMMLFYVEDTGSVETDCSHRDSGDLTLCKQMAVALAGDLRIDSVSGNRTRTTLSFPIGGKSREMVKDLQEVKPFDADRVLLDGSMTGRILLAEDRRDHQRLTSFILKRAGLDVDIAVDGQEACQLALDAWQRSEPYDVILMDIEMPKMNGLDATAHLRAHGYEGPIIAVTANTHVQSADVCRKAGCDDHASKPLSCSGLVNLIAKHLELPMR